MKEWLVLSAIIAVVAGLASYVEHSVATLQLNTIVAVFVPLCTVGANVWTTKRVK